MDWPRVIVPILGVIGLAFLFWWMEKNKVTSPVAWGAIGIGLILLLLWLEGWLGNALLVLLFLLRSLDHLPSWLVRTVLGLGIGYFLRYIVLLIAQMIFNLGVEIDKTSARLKLMESSLNEKLDEIASRLPERDEPDYLKRLREEGTLD